MRRRDLTRSALALLGVAVLGAFFMIGQGRDARAQAADTPGPNLVLEIASQGSDTPVGKIVIDLLPKVAPNHVARIEALTKAGAYDGVVFHRVIEGFMAQTGDVKFGKLGGDLRRAGQGGSEMPNLKAEFSNVPFVRGTVGMARAMDPDSANSQFFIMFAPAPNLNGKYTVVGRVISGLDVLDRVKKGDRARNGLVGTPDYILHATITQ